MTTCQFPFGFLFRSPTVKKKTNIAVFPAARQEEQPGAACPVGEIH